jgi:hypothetical protein
VRAVEDDRFIRTKRPGYSLGVGICAQFKGPPEV